MYSDKVMDHFSSPRNMGEIENPSAIGQVGNAKCGDIMKIYLKVTDNGIIEDRIIEDIRFKTFGCGAAIATSSVTTELVKGKKIKDALKLTNKVVIDVLDGLPPAKVHCSVLAEEALRAAIADYCRRQGIDPEPIVGCSCDCVNCHCDSKPRT